MFNSEKGISAIETLYVHSRARYKTNMLSKVVTLSELLVEWVITEARLVIAGVRKLVVKWLRRQIWVERGRPLASHERVLGRHISQLLPYDRSLFSY